VTALHEGSNIQIGLVGLGGHGRTIQSTVERTQGLVVASVYDPNGDEAAQAAARFGCRAAGSFEELLETPGLEAVTLATPNTFHRDQAIACFDRRLHVFVEKPIANSVRESVEIVEAARKADRVLMVGHNMRFSPSARKTKEYLEGGRLGDIVSVEVHFSADNTQRMAANVWRLTPEACPLLPVMQLGVHAIDLLHYFLGPIASVAAVSRSVTTRGGVIDNAAALMTLDDGTPVTFVSNYCTQVLFEIRFAGTTGTLHHRNKSVWYRASVDSDRDGKGEGSLHDYSDQPTGYFDQMQAFYDAIARGGPVETDGPGAVRTIAVVEAMIESADRREVVRVKPFEYVSA
jgi:predicted dehydrogenase